MSPPSDQLRDVLLDLGLEDWIPIPEAMSTPEVQAAMREDSDPAAAVGHALADLLDDGKVALYKGRWDRDPKRVSRAEGAELLRDPKWYRYDLEDPDEQRLYFVNVGNILT